MAEHQSRHLCNMASWYKMINKRHRFQWIHMSLPLMNTKSWIFSCKSLHHMKCSKTACLLVSQPVTVLVSLTVLRLIVSPAIGKTDNESKGLTTIAIGQGMRVRLTTIMLLLSLLHSTKTQPNYKQTGWQVLYMSARVIALILSHNWKCDNPLHESPTNQKQYMYIKNMIKEGRRSVSPAWQQWLPAQQARCQHDHRVDNESEGLIRIPEGLTVQHVCLTTIMSLLLYFAKTIFYLLGQQEINEMQMGISHTRAQLYARWWMLNMDHCSRNYLLLQ